MEENDAYLDCVNDDINTTNSNGKMISRILTSVSQNEVERTSERTKFGMVGAIKQGHIPHKALFGYKHTKIKNLFQMKQQKIKLLEYLICIIKVIYIKQLVIFITKKKYLVKQIGVMELF